MRIDISQSLKAAKTEADFHTSGSAGILLQADIFPNLTSRSKTPMRREKEIKKAAATRSFMVKG